MNQYQIGETEAEVRSARAKALAAALRSYQGGTPARFGGPMKLSAPGSVKRHGPADGEYAQPYGGQALDSAHD